MLASALRGSTPFILVARDVVNLLEGDEWINLQRSLRLLQDASISVVAGASREGTLHFYICFKLFAMLHEFTNATFMISRYISISYI